MSQNGNRVRVPWWLAGIGMTVGIIGGLSAIIGMPSCSELQTKAEAQKQHESIEAQNRAEHDTFRAEIKDIRKEQTETWKALLERLPPKRGHR